MAAVLYWRLPELTPIRRGPLPWLPGIPEMLHAHPVWGAYLAKRSQLVVDLADQVQDHACHGDGQPVWAAPETHLSTALIREIAVWRAANGIKSPGPATNRRNPTRDAPGPLETSLDRHIAHSTDSSDNASADERQAAHTALRRWHDHSQRQYQKPERRPSGPSARGR